MQSIVQEMGRTNFPEHLGERVYMRAFTQRDGLPEDLRRWQPTVDAMLERVDAPGPIYLMVDQGIVKAGMSHRRPGLHIDGYWVPNLSAHGGGGGHSSQRIETGRHSGGGSHSYRAPSPEPAGAHRGGGRHMSGSHGGWANADYREAEGIILSSSVTAARAFAGEFHGQPGEGGDCSHIEAHGLIEVPLLAGRIYAGNVTMLHESLPVATDCLRTVVRLNVPGWTPH